jgi:hypothetical protein
MEVNDILDSAWSDLQDAMRDDAPSANLVFVITQDCIYHLLREARTKTYIGLRPIGKVDTLFGVKVRITIDDAPEERPVQLMKDARLVTIAKPLS